MQKEKEMILEMTGQIMNQKGKDEFHEKDHHSSHCKPHGIDLLKIFYLDREGMSQVIPITTTTVDVIDMILKIIVKWMIR